MKVWAPFLGICAIALGRALTAAPPERAPESDDELLHRAFRAVASEETDMRKEAAKTFPTDPWSRDDDFHLREWRKIREWGGNHRVRLEDVVGAVDRGLREHWPQDNPAPLVVTVPPCQPRAIY